MAEEEIKYRVIRNFGPSVFKVKIPKNILEILNNLIDEILENKERSEKLNHGNKLVGDVTQEILLDKEVITKSGWLNFISTCVHKWIEIETGKKISKFQLIQSWVVRQFQKFPKLLVIISKKKQIQHILVGIYN